MVFLEKSYFWIPAAQSEDLQSSIQTTQPGALNWAMGVSEVSLLANLEVLAVQYESIDNSINLEPRAGPRWGCQHAHFDDKVLVSASWMTPSKPPGLDGWLDGSWSSPPNSSEAIGISTYSSRYRMNSCDIWISYEYHMNIMWISLSLVSLSLIHQMLQPVSRYLERCHVAARYVDLNLPGFEALGTTNIASGEPGWIGSLLIPAIGGKIVGSFSQIFQIIFWHFIFEYSWWTSTIGTTSLVFKVQNLITEEAMTAMILFDHFAAQGMPTWGTCPSQLAIRWGWP